MTCILFTLALIFTEGCAIFFEILEAGLELSIILSKQLTLRELMNFKRNYLGKFGQLSVFREIRRELHIILCLV